MLSKLYHKLAWMLLRSKSDIEHLLAQAQQKNLITQHVQKLIQRLLSVSDITVDQIMTDKAQTITINESCDIKDILSIYKQSKHSRYPIINNEDKIIGLLLVKDLLYQMAKHDSPISLKSITRPAHFATESQSILSLLKELQQQHKHMAIVLDEYAQFTGIVTIENILEQLVGDIEDEHDTEQPNYITQKTSNTYITSGLTPIEQFNQQFDTHIDTTEFDTIAGILSKRFGHIPQPGEQIKIDHLSISILKASPTAIQKIRVTKEETS